MILTKPVPHKEAAAAIRSKPVVSRAVFAEMLPELRALAFTITITEELKTAAALRQSHAELAKVREALATLPEGRDYEEVKAEILGRLSPYFKSEAAARNRAELLLRLHGGQAYAAAQYRVLDRQRDVFPYWKYVSFGDDRVRATHRALNQKIFPADSPFWDRHFPPWEFMCRCRVVGITQGEADRIREREKDLPLAKRTLMEGAALNLAVNQNKLASPEDDGTQYDLTTPSERDPDGYRWHPGQIGQGLDGLRRQVDPAQWNAFEAKAKRVRIGGGRSLWDALEKGQGAAARAQSKGRPLAILTPEKRAAVLKALGMTEADLAAWRAKELAPRTPYPAPTPAAPAAPAVAPAVGLSATALVREQIRSAVWAGDAPIGTGVNTTIRVFNGVTVVFKPQDGECDPRVDAGRKSIPKKTQLYREKAASIIDEELGLGLVPPTEIITYKGKIGSAQLWSPAGFEEAAKRMRNGTLGPATARISVRTRHDWQLLDDLLRHSDRHLGNFMLDMNGGVVLIDNGLSAPVDKQDFRGGKRFNQAGLDGKVIDAVNLQRLRDFVAAEAGVRQKLGTLLEPAAVDLIFTRAKKMLSTGVYPDDSAHPSSMPW